MATREQYSATRQELSDTWQPASGALNFTYISLAGFPRLLLHHDGSMYVLAAAGAIMWLRPEYQINDGAWIESGWGVDGLKRSFPNGIDSTIPMQCNRPCFPGAYPAGTTIRTRMMAKCSGSVVLCDSNRIPQVEAINRWIQSESHQWNEAEDDINPVVPEVIFEGLLGPKGSPVTTGDIWGNQNIGTHFIQMDGHRYVWLGGRQDYAQVVVGSIDDDGNVTQGTLNEHNFPGEYFGGGAVGNIYGVTPIGNNKFIVPGAGGFVVFDCGASGTVSSVFSVETSNIPDVSIAGFRDGIMYSGGKLYMIGGHKEMGGGVYYHLALGVASIDNSTGSFSSPQVVGSTFGDMRSVFYTTEASEANGCVRGACIGGGGVVFAARTADVDESSNPGMDFSVCHGSSINNYRCQDADGYPLAISVDSNGVFAVLYIMTTIGDRRLRVRVGKITNHIPVFGGHVDLYGGAGFSNLVRAGMCSEFGKFALVVQEWEHTARQGYFVISSSDGVNVTCSNPNGAFSYHATNSPPQVTPPIDIVNSGFPGIFAVGNYGSDTFDFGSRDSRFTTALIALDIQSQGEMESGVPAPVAIALGEWKFWNINSQSGDTQLTVSLTGLDPTADLDLYVLAGAPPRYKSDGYSENPVGANEQIVIANTAATSWWIGVYGYAGGGNATLTATLS